MAGGSVALAGSASVYAWRRRAGGDTAPPAAAVATSTATAAVPTSTPEATPTPVAIAPRGEARLVAPRLLNFDTFDAARTGEVSVLEVLGRTHSRLLRWNDDPLVAEVEADLATGWEAPDELTWIFRLDPAARWNEGEGLPSAALSADDVVRHFERVVSLSRDGGLQQVQRPWDWQQIDAVDSPGEGMVRFRTTAPNLLFPAILAGAFALVQRPASVDLLESDGNNLVPGHLSGSGPYIFEGFDERRRLQFRAAPDSGHGGPARLLVSGPGASVTEFSALEVDEYLARDRRDAQDARAEAPAAVEQRMWEDAPVISTFAVGNPPWNDPRLRLAISAALNRHELVERLFGGRAEPSSPVSPAYGGFALEESMLESFAGHRSYEVDAREARSAWNAAGGESLGEVTIDFPAPFDPRYSASSVVIGMLREALGGSFRPAVDSYVNISRKAIDGQYGNGSASFWFGWGPALALPDPSLPLMETYDSTSATARSHGYSDPEVDRILAALRSESDSEAKRTRIHELQRLLLRDAAGGVLTWAHQRSEHFVHPYLRGRQHSPFPGRSDLRTLAVDPGHELYPR